MSKLIQLLLIFFLLSSCVSITAHDYDTQYLNVRSLDWYKEDLRTECTKKTDYIVGKVNITRVGDPLFLYQPICLKTAAIPILNIKEDIEITTERDLNSKNLEQNNIILGMGEYKPIGVTRRYGDIYFVYKFINKGMNSFHILCDTDGVLYPNIALADYRVDTSNKWKFSNKEKVKITYYSNIIEHEETLISELLYSGSNKTEMFFKYREYLDVGLARTAFYQDLVYQKGTPIIQFKNFRIKILSANNEQVSFIILSD